MPFFKVEYPQKRPVSEEESLAYSLGLLHAHCEGCYNRKCALTPDELSSCSVIDCPHNCGQRFHQCKGQEHEVICPSVRTHCLNVEYGCPLWMPRSKLSSHLLRCPASVVRCVIEWNRWPMHSARESVRAPLPIDNPHVTCGQLDVALAMRDQRVLQKSMKTPRKVRKVFQNSITMKYPSVPLEATRSNSIEEHPLDMSQNESDDDTDAPWEASKYPPGLQKSVVRSIYKASQETTESLSYALDFVSSHIGRTGLLEKIKEVKEGESAKEAKCLPNGPQADDRLCEMDSKCNDREGCEDGVKEDSEVKDVRDTSAVESNDAEVENSDENCALPQKLGADRLGEDRQEAVENGDLDADLVEKEQSEEDIQNFYEKKIKLHELLGVSLNIECISKYQTKPIKMFTFLCAQNFRRDEYAWHFKNVHNDIQCGLNGLLEQRCPLADQGCDFTFRRMYPKMPEGQVVHSSLLESFGLVTSNEGGDNMQSFTDTNLHCVDDVGKRRLREATPEIITSCKYDSCIKIFPRYRRCSGCHSNQSLSDMDNQGALLLTSLPFEVLQHIAVYLDGFSLCNLSLTCRILRHVCCALLEQKGMVVITWEPKTTESGVTWQVAGRKWCFSTAFTPVREWGHETSAPLFEHLKHCPYNQEKDKVIRKECFQLIELGLIEEGGKKAKKYRDKEGGKQDQYQQAAGEGSDDDSVIHGNSRGEGAQDEAPPVAQNDDFHDDNDDDDDHFHMWGY